MKASAAIRSGKNRALCLLIIFVVLLTALPLSACSNAGDRLIVDVLDVGKADCIVLRHNGQVLMIDTAEEENLPAIRAHLSANGISRIDVLVISHFDKDHVGGAAGILREYDVGSVFITAFEKDNEETLAFLDALAEKDIEPVRLTENRSLSLGDVSLTLFPPKESTYAVKEDNNASLVVLAEIDQKRLLFCGDAMEDRIGELLTEDLDRIDFLKIPYHGKELGNLDALLDKTTPASCAITCSKKNPPAESVLSLLEEKGVETYLTEDGTVRVSLEKDPFSDDTPLRVTQY